MRLFSFDKALLVVAMGLLLPARLYGSGNVETFDGYPAGTVVAGTLPQGGQVNSGLFFPNIVSISVHNNAGPQSAILFDSSHPTGADWDLGTPNETCGGPGVGAGGEFGQPGQNCVPYRNLLIIAENLEDLNKNNIVDNPDDETDGGSIRFQFAYNVKAASVALVDVDGESAKASLINGVLTLTFQGTDLGDNSVQVVDLSGMAFNFLEIRFSGSGAIAQINYDFPVSVSETTWGQVKSRYR